MNYRQAVAELEALPIMPDRAPSLGPTRDGLARLGLSFPEARVVIVAGTNGKGSVCACLEALLRASGQTTGFYSSPHLVQITERFRRNGEDISQEEFTGAYVAVCERTRGIKLTHFEILTLMGYWIFAGGEHAPAVDWMILEVGLGGTWDATNAIPHRNCVIASLGVDHQNLLGSTLPEIAANKFGVISEGALVVHSPFPAEVRSLAREVEARTHARFVAAAEFTNEVTHRGSEPVFSISTRWGRTELSLPGARGALNAATALSAFEALGFDPARALGALSQVKWPGRMERFMIAGAPCPVYLSGDHNSQGIQSLLELLSQYPRRKLHLLVGVGRDKDLDGILGPLRELSATRLVLTETPFRGRALADYGRWLELVDGAEADPARALQGILKEAAPEDMILVTGSLYLVGAIRALSP